MNNTMESCAQENSDLCRTGYTRLRRAVQGTSDGLWEWDLVNHNVWYAPRFLELLEVTSNEFPATLESWTDRIHPEDYDTTWDAILRHLLDNELYDVKCRLRTSCDNYRWFRARGTAYRDEAGQPVCMSGSISDIDDLQTAYFQLQEKEAQLLQQQKLDALGSLASGIAHEFNNLLQTMRGYTQFAYEAIDVDSQASQDLECVLTAAERASELTRQMLDFSRCDKLDARPCLIDNVVQDLVEMLKPLLPNSIDLRLNTNACDKCVQVDVGQIQQALLNLCLNSRDAMPAGGVLVVSTESTVLSEDDVLVRSNLQPGPCVRITVSDSGVGITPAAQEHIFEPFYTTKEVGKGTGLGLAVAFGVVQQANGHIECCSSGKHGTKFMIHLPICDQPISMIPFERSH